jgi:hypothetical protein
MYERVADPDSKGVFNRLAPDGDRRSLATEPVSLVATLGAPLDSPAFASIVSVLNYEFATATADQAVV